MKKSKTALSFFFIFIAIFWYLFWQIAQSSFFSKKLSSFIEDRVSKESLQKVSFEKVQLSFFPPGIYLEDVKVNEKSLELSAEFRKVGLVFSSFNLGASFIQSKIVLEDGMISLKLPKNIRKSRTNKRKDIINTIFKNISHFQKKIPFNIRKLELKKISIDVNSNKFFSKSSHVSFGRVIKIKSDLDTMLEEENLKQFDNIFLEASLSRRSFFLKKLTVKSGFSTININGNVKFLPQSVFSYDLKAFGQINFLDIFFPKKIKDIIDLKQGEVAFEAKITGQNLEPKVKGQSKITNLHSKIINGKEVDTKFSVNAQGISLSKFELKTKTGQISLDKSFLLYNRQSNKWLAESALLNIKKIELENALSYIPTIGEKLKGKVSGKVKLSLSKNDELSFLFIANSYLENFKLKLDAKSNENFIHHPRIEIPKMLVSVNLQGNDVKISSSLVINKMLLEANGSIKNDYIDFSLISDDFSFEDFGRINDLDFKGAGGLDLAIKGHSNDVFFDLKGQFTNFEFLKFSLGETQLNMTISLGQSKILLNKVISKVGKTQSGVKGSIEIESNPLIQLQVKHKGNFGDIKKIYKPILEGVDFINSGIEGLLSAQYDFKGRTNISSMEVLGKISGNQFSYYQESFQEFETQVLLKDQKIKLDNFSLLKKTGKIKGSFSYDLENQDWSVTSSLNNLALNEINYISYYDVKWGGLLNGKVALSKSETLQGQGKIFIDRTLILGEDFGKSDFSYSTSNKNLFIESSFFNKSLIIEGSRHLTQFKETSLDISLDSNKLSKILQSFFSDLDLREVQIAATARMKASFSHDLLSNLNASFALKNFSFLAPWVSLIEENSGIVSIAKGKIEKWKFILSNSSDFFFTSEGKGSMDDKVFVKNEFKLNPSFLKIFLPKITSADGIISGKMTNSLIGTNFFQHTELEGQKIYLKYADLIGNLDEGFFKISSDNKKINLDSFKAKFLGGVLEGFGEGTFLTNGLKLDLQYVFKDLELRLFEKTLFKSSGEGTLKGDSPPYILAANAAIVDGYIKAEFADFNSTENFYFTKSTFLPEKNNKKRKDFFSYDIDFDITNEFAIRNSQIDCFVKGSGEFIGPASQPKFIGNFSTIPEKSFLNLNGNRFSLDRGDVSFLGDQLSPNPKFDIQSSGAIESYIINMSASGRVDSFKTELSSNPPLSQKDIFSLITFGYTNDVSQNLEEEDASFSSLSFGSFILDQFEINDGLRSMLGLNINVGSAVLERRGSYLAGRTDNQLPINSRYRTATKVEVSKRLREKVNISVSSTLGSGIGQKQNMNINYKLDKNISLEGIYEIRTDEEGLEDVIDTSAGADLKFRWKFK